MDLMQITIKQFPDHINPAMQAIFKDAIDDEDYASPLYKNSKEVMTQTFLVSQRTGLGYAMELADGATKFTEDRPYEGYNTTLTQAIYGLQVTTGLHFQLFDRFDASKGFAADLSAAISQTSQIIFHAPFNNAFVTALGDGVSLCNPLHPAPPGVPDGSIRSNVASTPGPLSYSTMQNDIIAAMKITGERGYKRRFVPETVLIPLDSMFSALAIEKSPLDPASANNPINVIRSAFPGLKYHADPFLKDSRRHFYLDKDREELRRIWRQHPILVKPIVNPNQSITFLAYVAFACGATGWTWIFGNAGI
jgi:hypothetical protein